jgi:conjugative transfer signal peptidase TraF
MKAKRVALNVWIMSLFLVGGVALAYQQGLRFNSTASMPTGIYKANKLDTSLITRGSIALLCPPQTSIFHLAYERHYLEQGNCPGHLQSLLKPVGAVAGDIVRIGSHGVSVNGKLMPRSLVLREDSAGRPITGIPAGVYRVKPGEVWLLSSHSAKSFDSRYFGPVTINAIQGTAQPILTWGKSPQRKGEQL